MVKLHLYGIGKHLRHQQMWKPVLRGRKHHLSLLSLCQRKLVLISYLKFNNMGCLKKTFWNSTHQFKKSTVPDSVIQLLWFQSLNISKHFRTFFTYYFFENNFPNLPFLRALYLRFWGTFAVCTLKIFLYSWNWH